MRKGNDRTRAEIALAALAPSLMLLVPFISHLNYHRYPILLPESLLALAVLLACTGLIGLLIALSRGILGPALLSLLLVVTLDHLGLIGPLVALSVAHLGVHGLLVALPGALIASALLCMLLRRHLGTVLSTSFAVMLAATLLLPGDRIQAGVTRDAPAEPRQDLPPVVHIILDEQIGIEGLPLDVEGAAELQAELRAFYLERGFRLYGGAYSQYRQTHEALPALLTGRLSEHVFELLAHAGSRKWLLDNAWFRDLSEAGYRIWVYQSDYMDFCEARESNVDFCYTYPSNSVHALYRAEIGNHVKARVLLGSWLSTSLVNGLLKPLYQHALDQIAPSPRSRNIWLGPLASLAALEHLEADVPAGPRGVVYFAHLLLPHSSYVFDARCEVWGQATAWLTAGNPNLDLPSRNTSESRLERYHLYLEQVRCTHLRLAAFLDEMEARGVLADATVILHGDHGSRIEINTPFPEGVQQSSERDFIDAYSTLFAVRKPGLAPGYEREMRSIQGLFAEMFLPGVEPIDESLVFLRPLPFVVGDRLGSVPMPVFVD